MKTILFKISSLLMLFVFIFPYYTFADSVDSLTIQECLDSNFIKTNVKSLGGFQEECIFLSIENITDKDLNVILEPGRRLVSDDSTIQDILIVKKVIVLVSVGEKKKINGYGFCCQASFGGPFKDAVYSIGRMASENLVKLANIINENDFPTSAVQHAIWVISDGHTLSSVYDANSDTLRFLHESLAEILDIEIPWYYLTYVQDTARLFSDRPKTIYGKFDYYIKNNSIITINIRNFRGEVVKTLIEQKPKNPGTYTYHLNLNVVNFPKGNYEIYVYTDYGQTIVKKEFEL